MMRNPRGDRVGGIHGRWRPRMKPRRIWRLLRQVVRLERLLGVHPVPGWEQALDRACAAAIKANPGAELVELGDWRQFLPKGKG